MSTCDIAGHDRGFAGRCRWCNKLLPPFDGSEAELDARLRSERNWFWYKWSIIFFWCCVIATLIKDTYFS